MAQRQCDITIKSWGTGGRAFEIFSDVPTYLMERVKGIVSVYTGRLRDEGYIIVHIDGRYKNKEVLADIEALQERITNGEIPRRHSQQVHKAV